MAATKASSPHLPTAVYVKVRSNRLATLEMLLRYGKLVALKGEAQ